MADSETTLEAMRQNVAEFVRMRNWEQFHNPRDLAAAISIEASELQELLLWKTALDVDEFLNDAQSKDLLCGELADVLIFSLCLANRLKIDVADIVSAKLKQNAEKYPVEKSRNRSAKYTQL